MSFAAHCVVIPNVIGRGESICITVFRIDFMKALLPDLQISTMADGTSIVNAAGRYFTVSEQTVFLLRVLQSTPAGHTVAELAPVLSAKVGFEVTAEEVQSAIDTLPPTFFAHGLTPKHFSWSVPLIQGRMLDLLAHAFATLFAPAAATVLVLIATYALWRIDQHYVMAETGSLLVPALVLMSIVFHEIGHAAACRRGGARPSLIGIGIKGLLPTFYTDVSDIWSRGRWPRIRVDLGGVYFQFLYAAALTLLVPWHPEVLLAIKLTLLLAAFSCLPYFKFDGYWLLGDLLQVNSLDSWLRNHVRTLRAAFANRALSISHLPLLAGVGAYYAGMGALLIWVGTLAVMLFATHWNTLLAWSHGTGQGPLPLTTLMITALLAIIGIGVLRPLYSSVREFRFLTDDLMPMLGALLLVCLMWLVRPLLHLPRKHKAYLDAVTRGLNKAAPPIPAAGRVAVGSLMAKYYELIWYKLLGRMTPAIGLWLIRITHRTRSVRTLADVIHTPGPVILAAPHFGSFISGALSLLAEIGAARPIHLFYADPATDPGNGGYEAFYRRYFPSLSVCFNNKRGIIHAVKALRRGEVLVIMPDVFQGADLIKVELLGREIGTMAGIAYFHQKLGATVIPVLSRFKGLVAVDVHVGEAMAFAHYARVDTAPNVQIMEELFAWFARWFRQHPQDWHCWDKFGEYALPVPSTVCRVSSGS